MDGFALPRDTGTSGALPDETGLYPYRNSSRSWVIVTQSVCLTVSTVCIGMRLYTKLLVTRAPGWEDLTCSLAWLGLIGYAVIAIEADKHGNGVHLNRVAPSDLQEFSKLANASQITYAPLIFITKLSIFLLYLRVFAPNRRGRTYWVIQALIGFNLAFYLANFFLKIFECSPRRKIWDKDTPGHCIQINIPILVTSIINVISDLMMLLLPIFCVWRLQMTTKRKLGTSAIFAAGAFGCLASIMRLVVSIRKRDSKDKTYDWYPQFLWTTAEVTSGILASSLPALPTFFHYFFQKAKTILSTGSSSQVKTWVKPADTYTMSTMRRSRFGHDLLLTDHSDADRDVDEDEVQIYRGVGYTKTEARAEGRHIAVERDIQSRGGMIDGEDGRGPNQGQGILKIVEVDIESGPGGRE